MKDLGQVPPRELLKKKPDWRKLEKKDKRPKGEKNKFLVNMLARSSEKRWKKSNKRKNAPKRTKIQGS